MTDDQRAIVRPWFHHFDEAGASRTAARERSPIMYYVIERTQTLNLDREPNPTIYLIQTEPGRTNLSHEVCTEGWLGTTSDIAEYAHGAFETLEAARNRIGEVAGDAGVRGPFREDGEGVGPPSWPSGMDDSVVEEWAHGTYPVLDQDALNGWVQGDTDVTAATTDAEIEDLVAEHQRLAREEWGGEFREDDLREALISIRNELAEQA